MDCTSPGINQIASVVHLLNSPQLKIVPHMGRCNSIIVKMNFPTRSHSIFQLKQLGGFGTSIARAYKLPDGVNQNSGLLH